MGTRYPPGISAADRARVGDHLGLGVWGAGAQRGGARRRDQERVWSQAVLRGGTLEDWGRGWVGVRLPRGVAMERAWPGRWVEGVAARLGPRRARAAARGRDRGVAAQAQRSGAGPGGRAGLAVGVRSVSAAAVPVSVSGHGAAAEGSGGDR